LINKSVQKKEKSEVVLLSLGSNLGSKSENIKKAIEFLKERQILEDIQVSSFYETEPVGFKNQPDFLNVAIIGRTNLTADELLHECKNIEKELGRKERPRWHDEKLTSTLYFMANIKYAPKLSLFPIHKPKIESLSFSQQTKLHRKWSSQIKIKLWANCWRIAKTMQKLQNSPFTQIDSIRFVQKVG